MADIAATPASPTSPIAQSSPRPDRAQWQERNRGRGQGSRGSRGQRQPGRGRGRGSDNGPTTFTPGPGTQVETQPNGPRAPGGFGARRTESASNGNGSVEEGKPLERAVTEDEFAGCFICANPIEHTSIAPCNHQTCHICSLRLRALYKNRACASCRTEAPHVIFTDNPNKRFQDFAEQDFVKVDDNLGIQYEKNDILEDTVLLLRYNCPDPDCDVACLGWPDLHRHVKGKHGKIMCDLCTRNKKVFTHEHELFTFSELRRHEKFGDDRPGAIDQSGFRGHPECGFCKERFYDDDALYTHCREKHERCHICDRRNGGRNPQYYLNYQELEKHFAESHFVCLDAECQANKTNVFESEMDLKAHQLSEHPNGLSKDARRDTRLVNLSGFDLRTPYQPEQRNRRENRSSGRGRDPNADALPRTSAQPMSRAELAYQRQMAIQSAQSVQPRTFGGQLTQAAPQPRHQPPSSPRPAQSLPAVESLSIAEHAAPTTNLTPQEQARQLRHTTVTNRATQLLKNDPTKLSQFRTHVSSYRSGTTSANELIDSFFSLFDCPSSELGKLIRELADLYEDEAKRQSLLEAWNSWRSINEDYPSLPGPSGTDPSATTNLSSGRRVLKLKSSTAQSQRSHRHGSWGSANALPPNATTDPYPSLSSSSARKPAWTPAVNTLASRISTTGTSTPHAAPTGVSRPAARITSTRPPSTMGKLQNADMFPSLPTAAKPSTLMAGIHRGTVRWDMGNAKPSSTPVNPWAAGGVAPTPAQAAAAGGQVDDEYVESGAGGGKKKGKKGKGKGETLFHFG